MPSLESVLAVLGMPSLERRFGMGLHGGIYLALVAISQAK
jgi:hypothetical protein